MYWLADLQEPKSKIPPSANPLNLWTNKTIIADYDFSPIAKEKYGSTENIITKYLKYCACYVSEFFVLICFQKFSGKFCG